MSVPVVVAYLQVGCRLSPNATSSVITTSTNATLPSTIAIVCIIFTCTTTGCALAVILLISGSTINVQQVELNSMSRILIEIFIRLTSRWAVKATALIIVPRANSTFIPSVACCEAPIGTRTTLICAWVRTYQTLGDCLESYYFLLRKLPRERARSFISSDKSDLGLGIHDIHFPSSIRTLLK